MNRILRLTTAALLAWVLSSACSGTQQLARNQAVTSPPCHFYAGRLNISWMQLYRPQELELPLKQGADSLPQKFTAFRINTQSLNSFIKGIDGIPYQKKVINMPVNGGSGCLLFHLEDSGTLPEAWQKKHPELKSLKSVSSQDTQAELRLDFDGETIKAAITHDGQVEFLSPWADKNGTLYYLLYDQADAGHTHIPVKDHY